MQSMNPNTPAMNQKEYDAKIDRMKKCGENRGPHDYIPMEWNRTETSERVTHLLCRVCFNRINVSLIYKHFPEITF